MNNKEKTKETYDKIALNFSTTNFDPFWIDEFDIYKNLIDGKKVLDIGCGAGRDAAIFVEDNFEYTGIDASSGMLKVAAELVPTAVFKQMDFYTLEFSENSFDGFWAAASFLHVPKKDVRAVLQEAKRVLKPGGVGFISIREKVDIDEGMVEQEKYGGVSRYFAFYTQEEFKHILEDNGFEVVKMTTHREEDGKINWLSFFVKK
jgi:ubiquinone/menaquinone biosynthesis C-methylase UbiE